MSQAETNKVLVRDFFKAMNRGDVEAIVNTYADDGYVHTMGHTLISGRAGKQQIQDSSSRIFEVFPGGIQLDIQGMTAEGERVTDVLCGGQRPEAEAMTGIKLAMGMFGLGALFGDEAMGMVHASRIAEQAGIDQVVFQDHVAMGENTDKYPFGEFPLPPQAPWLEPMVLMSAVAAGTETIRISSGVIISPLRPAALLAKMVA